MARTKKQQTLPRAVRVSVPAPDTPADPADDAWRAECAKIVVGWEAMPEAEKRQTAANLRRCMEAPKPAAFELSRSETGAVSANTAPGRDDVVNAIQLEAMFSGSGAHAMSRLDDLLGHFAVSNPIRGCSDREINAALAFVAGAGVEDTVQSTLAVQMVVTHDAAMRALRALGANSSIEASPVFGNLAVKLLNAYTRQAETLAKLKRGGEQIVRHIHVDNRGGQAVIAEQFIAGGQNGESRDQPHEQSSFGSALLGQDPAGYGVPIASDEGEEAVSIARRAVDGRAQR